MRRLFYVVFWLTLSATIAFLALSKYEVAEHLETQVIGSIETGDLSRLWYSPSGDLVGVTENEALLNVRIWKSDSSRQLIRESAIALPPTKAGVKPVYAVLADATKAAWVNPTGVHVQSLVPPMGDSAAAIPFKRKAAISALEFTGSGQILALYHDGELELWDPAGERVTASKHIDIADPATLLVSGPYVAAYSGASGNAFVFDAGSGDKLSLLEYTKYPREALSVTLSPQARFAAGTRETLELEGHTLAAPGPVRSLAYFDRDALLAGRDFAGL